MSEELLEIVVYGDAPEGEGSTDTISIPLDFIAFYEPAGPTIVMPPTHAGGGGGGDTGNPIGDRIAAIFDGHALTLVHA